MPLHLNQDTLSLLTLGIREDQPPVDSGQPPLPDGIHFRWAPDQTVGFPWYGFYLFRRETQPSRPRCLSAELGRFRPGTSQSLRLETALGRLTSAKPLVFTEDFPPAGRVEVDLGQGAPLRFDLPAGVEARRVDVSLGLRDVGPQSVRTCVDFRGLPLGISPSPRAEKGAIFRTTAPPVSPFVAVAAIEQWPGSPTGLQTTPRLEITLFCQATRVDLLLTNRSAVRVNGLFADGGTTGAQDVAPHPASAGTVTLTGKAITQVTITSSTVDPALLHRICFDCPAGSMGGPGKRPEIEVRALAGTSVVAHAVVQGNAGQVVAATLEGTGITAVEIAPSKAALVDLCVWPAAQGVTFGWDPVPGFQYPLCLPVAASGYPCPGAPATPADAQTLAFSRVTYPAPTGWNADFTSLHDELTALV
ncbi:MAG TPA: hypothetical protein VGR07_17250, partial [Thermoanaerobaculia bacterium]|nr:hypothetical protein [Thermoanaerobaculia bacterium]